MPALSKAREKAKDNNCQSNLKQIGNYMLLYADSSNGYIARHEDGSPWWKKLEKIFPEINNGQNKSFHCPSQKYNDALNTGITRSKVNYSFNSALSNKIGNSKSVSEIHALFDGNVRKSGNKHYIYVKIYHVMYLPGMPYNASYQLEINPIHGRSNNHLFLDGHVKALNPRGISENDKGIYKESGNLKFYGK